jgi:hypothetical protein
MPKISAFGTLLKRGVCQVDTAIVVGTVTVDGNIHVVCTSTSLIAGSPLQTIVAVALNDTADLVASRIRTGLNAVAAITLNYIVGGSGPRVSLTAKVPAANDVNLNVDYHMDGATAGLTDDLTSENTVAGVALATMAYVVNISGPGLALDTADVTTHDQTTAFEELVATLLRSGELKVDIVYDPNNATHSAAAEGFIDDIENKKLAYYTLTFPGPYVWSFSGYATGFEPSSPTDGALTATCTIKITGAPLLV